MKQNSVWIALFGLLTVFFIGAQLLAEDRYYSEQENRLLQQKPEFLTQDVLDGTWEEAYESYLSDQFPWRNFWIRLKVETQKLLGQKDSNGVYFASDQTLIERHVDSEELRDKGARKLDLLTDQAAAFREQIPGEVYVMLVPTADTVWKEKLPVFAEDFDQTAYGNEAAGRLREIGCITVDAAGSLSAHKEEKIYYGTDHHWTTLGAFYGWQAFAEEKGLAAPSLEEYERIAVSDSFYGTLQAKVNLDVQPDVIEQFRRKGQPDAGVRFVYEEQSAGSLYFPEKLNTKDQYAYFLNGNVPLAEIEGFGAPEESILIIKDSYANCFVPFLLEHYGKIYLADPRYYRSGYEDLAGKYGVRDVLYLFDVIHFINDFQ